MNRFTAWVATHPRWAWSWILVMSLGMAWSAGEHLRAMQERERIALLELHAERTAVELLALTMNGNLMGSVAMLGLVDPDVKRDARQESKPNDPPFVNMLESVGRSHGAEGVFVVGTNGVVHSSWDDSNKPSTGIDVRFRPYFKMAVQGKQSVYAAISLATGRRAIYFASPVFASQNNTAEKIGAMVARSDPKSIDKLLANQSDVTLLLSPQGVVFSSNHSEWISWLDQPPTPERLKAIRDLKQFGALFENRQPDVLPLRPEPGFIEYEGRRHAVASAKVSWNDPSGDWRMVLVEDLERSAPLEGRVGRMSASGLGALVMLWMILKVLRGHHAQSVTASKLQLYAARQENSARHKSRLAEMSVRMQQAKGVEELARIFLSEAHAMLGVYRGVIYVRDRPGSDTLRLEASFGVGRDVPRLLLEGDGLLGQCAHEGRPILMTPPEGYWGVIRSGLGETAPDTLAVLPIRLGGVVLGVVELATLGADEEQSGAMRDEMVAMLALNLEIQRRNRDAEELLAKTADAERTKAGQLVFQQALLDTIPYPLFYKGKDTRFMGFNRAYEETFAVERGQLIGKRVMDLEYLPEADRKGYQAEDESVIASGTTVRREVAMPYADGTVHDTIYYASGFRLPDGSSGGMVGTFIDISELRAAERQLVRLSDAGYNRLIKSRAERMRALREEVNELSVALGRVPPYGPEEAEIDP
ncbi:MAG: GAF domain-containing protein [Magnetococcales bacterium]|nr:GAF domain-containing protein [Magnetococcales bacterium]